MFSSMENGEHKTPLMKAIDGGHASMVDRLIRAGASLDTADVWGTPPLLAAVFSGEPATIRILVQNGCDVDESSPKNPSVNPLSESLCRAMSITVMLVASGCDVHRALQHLRPPSVTERIRWLLDVASQPPSLQMIARRHIRKRLGHFRCRVRVVRDGAAAEQMIDKLELLYRGGLPRRMCDYIRCSELDDVLRTYEPSLQL
jgi:Ankyrin repeats (3 copies)/SOCS box